MLKKVGKRSTQIPHVEGKDIVIMRGSTQVADEQTSQETHCGMKMALEPLGLIAQPLTKAVVVPATH